MTDNYSLDIEATKEQSSYIKVIGVGGAGTNAVNHMFNKGITGVDFIICNTDEQSLTSSPIVNKIKIGEGGLGAGNNPQVAKDAAVASADTIKKALSENTKMLFVTAGMGGGTGTGASPEIAKIAKEIEIDGGKDEILVVGVVTTPFSFEGRKRKEQAIDGIEKLRDVVDAIIVVNNDKLKERGKMSMKEAFALADDVLLTAAKGIAEIMTSDAYIHVDFKDVQSVMKHSGVALMGSGVGAGEDRAYQAIKAATTSDLLNDNDLSQTKNILLYIAYSSKEEYELQMEEMDTITSYIQEQTSDNVDIIWGCGYNDELEDKIAITLVATGFESQEIYNNKQRNAGETKSIHKEEKIILPLEEEVKKEPEPIKEEEKEEDYIEGIKISNPVEDKLKEEKEKIEEQIKNENHKIVWTLDSVADEIDTNINSNRDNTTKAESNQEEDAIKIKEYLSHQAQTSIEAQPHQEEIKPVENTTTITIEDNPSLSSLINDTPQQAETKTLSVEERVNLKQERMKKIKEMLKTEKGIDAIASMRPAFEDVGKKISDITIKPTQLSLDEKSGEVNISTNKVINASVD